MRSEPLAVDRIICRYDRDQFNLWFHELKDKASMRIDSMAAEYLWERGYGVMDALVKIVGK